MGVAPAKAADITPHDLVFQGYQGRLKSEDIPGYASFRQAVFLGKIDAETLIQGAIAQGKLEPSAANNESYVRQVKSYLSLLRANGTGR
ncbi:MAG: hypothetical protein AAGE96_17945 [Cyanobacteria bacterium P01_G01_bin.19]